MYIRARCLIGQCLLIGQDKRRYCPASQESRLGMSVTTQCGSGRQYVTGSRRNISKYRFVLLNVYRFRET